MNIEQLINKLNSWGYHNWEIIPSIAEAKLQNKEITIYCNGYKFFKVNFETDSITVIIDRWTLENNLNVDETTVLNRFLHRTNLEATPLTTKHYYHLYLRSQVAINSDVDVDAKQDKYGNLFYGNVVRGYAGEDYDIYCIYLPSHAEDHNPSLMWTKEQIVDLFENSKPEVCDEIVFIDDDRHIIESVTQWYHRCVENPLEQNATETCDLFGPDEQLDKSFVAKKVATTIENIIDRFSTNLFDHLDDSFASNKNNNARTHYSYLLSKAKMLHQFEQTPNVDNYVNNAHIFASLMHQHQIPIDGYGQTPYEFYIRNKATFVTYLTQKSHGKISANDSRKALRQLVVLIANNFASFVVDKDVIIDEQKPFDYGTVGAAIQYIFETKHFNCYLSNKETSDLVTILVNRVSQ